MAPVSGGTVVAALLLSASTSLAATTPIQPPRAGEASHGDIFAHWYGGTFVLQANGRDFSNGSVTAIRIDDSLDTLFTTDGFDATARAVFADFSQTFGYLPGPSGGSFVSLFDVVSDGYAAAGSAAGVVINGEFRFARDGNKGVLASSLPADNADLIDHLVTYRVTGLGNPVLMLFWEDLHAAGSDFDYNDLVVEVNGARIVPTPAAVGAGLAMMTVGLLRRRRHA